MIVSVRCAFFTAGSRTAFTPLLTASTPVSAVQPLENTFKSSQKLTACVMAGGGGNGASGTGCPPVRNVRTKPPAIVMSSVPTKRYVGTMNAPPASRTPRELMIVMMQRMPTQIGTVDRSNDG